MRYNLEEVRQLCQQLGLPNKTVSDESAEWVEIDLGGESVLSVVNSQEEKDCLVGFNNTGWHFHDDFTFVHRDSGEVLSIDYLELLKGLKNGTVMVCEYWKAGALRDRRLLHADSDDMLHTITAVQSFPAGDEIRLWRAPK